MFTEEHRTALRLPLARPAPSQTVNNSRDRVTRPGRSHGSYPSFCSCWACSFSTSRMNFSNS